MPPLFLRDTRDTQECSFIDMSIQSWVGNPNLIIHDSTTSIDFLHFLIFSLPMLIPQVSDCLRYHRMEVSLGLRGHDDECLLTLHGLCSPYQQPSTERNHQNWGDGNDEGRQGRQGRGRCFALFAADHVEHVDHVDLSYGSFQNLSLTPQPMGPMRPMSSFDGNSPRSKAISPNRPPSMPSMSRVFRISKDGAIWAKVIQNVHTTSEHFALHW